MRLTIVVDGEQFDVEVERGPDGLRIACEDATMQVKGQAPQSAVQLQSGKDQWRVELLSDQEATINGRKVPYYVSQFTPGSATPAAGTQTRIPVRAVMHGRLVKVLIEPGQTVRRGEPLFVLEAMKMQNELASPAEGVVAELVAKPGDVVDVGRTLAWLERGKR